MSETNKGTMDEKVLLIDGEPASLSELLHRTKGYDPKVVQGGVWSPRDAAKLLERHGIQVCGQGDQS